MDEPLSWRGALAKSNINITHIDYDNQVVYFDFAYRPHSGAPQKWVKTLDGLKTDETWKELAERIQKLVLVLRKELE